MRKKLTGLVTALLLGGTLVGAASPAEAYWRGPGWRGGGYGYGYRHYHGGGAGLAVGAGILGLGVGALIASDHRRPVYYGGYDAPPPVYDEYYAPPPPPPSYYYQRDCRADYRWDGYAGRYVRVDRCR